jgi:hypothetical protein
MCRRTGLEARKDAAVNDLERFRTVALLIQPASSDLGKQAPPCRPRARESKQSNPVST